MICSQCNKEFNPSSHRQKYCSQECVKKFSKQYFKNYRQSDTFKKYLQSDKRKESVKNYRESDKGKKAKKRFRQTDAGKVVKKRSDKKYYQTDKGKAAKLRAGQAYEQSDLGKKYRQADKFKEIVNKRSRERKKIDPIFKLATNMRTRLGHFYKAKNMRKTNPTFIMVGCTQEYLKKHLEKQFKPGMNWENHTSKGWHIDHHIPLSSAKTYEDMVKLMHYTNCKPKWATENLKKGARH